VRYLDAAAVAGLGYPAAVAAITEALRSGLDPGRDPARTAVELSHGQFLLMPSESDSAAGVKVVTVAPGNPARGLPRIQAAYLLFDPITLGLTAVLDGAALTSLRTPAVSVAAVLPHLPPGPLRLAVVGSGPQATGHADAFGSLRPCDVTYLVREPGRAGREAVRLGSRAAVKALRAADVVVCATTARTSVFDSALLGDDVTVVAVGSHEPDARELDAALLSRSTVVVEDVGTALREAGDVVLAIREGALAPDDLVPLRDLAAGARTAPEGRPLVFKSVGMSWEDLVVAEAVLARTT
jgi:ornithine cyclodeaminase